MNITEQDRATALNAHTMNVTEADRATVRRIVRRMLGLGKHARIVRHYLPGPIGAPPMLAFTKPGRRTQGRIYRNAFDAACEAAALGRAYGRALRGAK